MAGQELSDTDMITDAELIQGLSECWASIDNILSALSISQWGIQTDCPGWNVQAQVSHLLGFEAAHYLGRTAPDPTPMAEQRHVHNELGADNERWVIERAHRDPASVLVEYRQVVAERERQLAGADLDAVSRTWRGDETMRDQLALRLFDIWVHEQDIRRAVEMHGGWDGIGARHALERMLASLPYLAARKAKLADGTTVALSLYGTNAQTVMAAVEGGRGNVVTGADHQPVAAITLSEEAFIRLTTGRTTPAEAMAAGLIVLRGNVDIARQLADHLRVVEI